MSGAVLYRKWPSLLGLALAFLAGPATLTAQSRSIRFEHLTVEDGLSQGTVNSIAQDGIGFLWLGTQDGLDRYDGYRFRAYRHDPEDPASLSSSWIVTLCPDPSGDLWIGTGGGGLSRWHRESDSFSHYRHDPDDPQTLSGDRVRAIQVDRRGQVWVATFASGLNRLDPESGRVERFRHDPADPTSLADDRLRALYQDRFGTLWIGTLDGLDRLDPAGGGFVHHRHDPDDPASLASNAVRSLLEDRAGTLWVGTEEGLHRRDPDAAGFVRYRHDPVDPHSLGHDLVRVLYEDRDGRLWIGTDGGLHLFERRRNGFARYRHHAADATSLSSDRVMSVFQDRSGVLWIGTQGGGINKWNPVTWSFAHYRAEPGDGLSSNAVSAFSEDRSGRLWVGTLGGGIDVLDRAGERVAGYRHDPAEPTSLSDDRVSSLLYDHAGTLWAGTLARGLNRLEPGARGFRRYRHDPTRTSSLSSDLIAALHQDRQGTIWVGTYGGGLDRLDRRADAFRHYRHHPGDPATLSHDQVLAFADEPDGLWIATFAGLDLLDPTTDELLRVDGGNADLGPTFALHRGDDALWLGTHTGLYRLDGLDRETGAARFAHWSTRDGLPNDTVWGIQPDSSGHLWLSTNRGLARFDPRAENFKIYGPSHGLQSAEFNYGAHYRSRDGELFFGGVNGFNAFYPERIATNETIPPVVLTSFTKLNRPMDLDRPAYALETITLGYDDYFFSCEVAALDFTAPEQNRYRYRLEGLDEDWIEIGSRRPLTFTNLDPGGYLLQVQGSNNDGVWNEIGLELAIEITPPFWLTWWFKIATVLAGAGVIFLGHGLRTRRIRKTNERLQILVQERTRALEEAQQQLLRRERLAVLGELAGSVAHEIRNPLGIMKNAIYFLRVKRKIEDPDVRQYLRVIEHEIDRSNLIIGELLDYARGSSSRVAVFTLQEACASALDEAEIPSSVVVERDLDGEPISIRGDRGQIERVLGNLLSNAVQAMEDGGTLRLSCRRAGEEAVVTVADTGVGIAAADLERIFEPLYSGKAIGIGLGLPLSRRYAELNQGRIECESELGAGATFRLILPATETRAEALATAVGS